MYYTNIRNLHVCVSYVQEGKAEEVIELYIKDCVVTTKHMEVIDQ